LFEFSVTQALTDDTIRREATDPSARGVIVALAEELGSAPRMTDRQTFRGAADRVKQKTGLKGRALFHPIRMALTGAGDGPELDLLVPAMERGAELDRSSGVAPILGARERAEQFARALDQ
jgi:glutamyl/glutaminyl-tRNA synthetase